ncbi:MAG: hypothetical protein K5895_11005 [Lachnospiraceae bacterium]|nr:hypothetical protein [Lachnospiraceae bacterium]
MNPYYALGVLVGVLVGLLLVVVFMKAINRDGKIKTEYDERQKEARGKGYMYGFWAIIIANALLFTFSNSFDMTVLGSTVYFIPILVGVIVQVTYCIFKDAYIGLNNNMTRFVIIMSIVTVFNLFVGVKAYLDGELIKQGTVSSAFVNVLCGGIFLILTIELGIKKILDSRAE